LHPQLRGNFDHEPDESSIALSSEHEFIVGENLV
jgi:hypothetical protein